MNDKNFQDLITDAKNASNNAYAPYSNFKVGASILSKSGNIFSGCNVENASYGLTQCAERNCISTAVAKGEKEFSSIVIYTEQEKLTPPCGACRQVIAEFCDPETLVTSVNHQGDQKSWTVECLLPNAFTPKDLLDK